MNKFLPAVPQEIPSLAGSVASCRIDVPIAPIIDAATMRRGLYGNDGPQAIWYTHAVVLAKLPSPSNEKADPRNPRRENWDILISIRTSLSRSTKDCEKWLEGFSKLKERLLKEDLKTKTSALAFK